MTPVKHDPKRKELTMLSEDGRAYVYWPVDRDEAEALTDRRSQGRVRSIKQVRQA